MPRPARPWFRFYVEAMRDPKMRRLTPPQRWLWVAVLAAARESCVPGHLFIATGVPLSWDDLADYAGMKVRDVEQGTDRMSELGMLAFDDEVSAWFVPAWNDRQFESDDVTARTSKHRSNGHGRNVPTNGVGTDQSTETEAETEPIGAQSAPSTNGHRKNGQRIPDAFEVTETMAEWAANECPNVVIGVETQKFVNYWKAKSGRDAVKLEWKRTWQNWILKAQQDEERRKSFGPAARR